MSPASPEPSENASPSESEARPSEDLVGRVVAGKYLVQKRIGRGGMGAVYEAENQLIGKKVALKFMDEEWAKNPEVASRFAREARAASLVDSEHIVNVFDAGTEGARPYIVMELLRGEDLGTRLRREGTLPWSTVKPMVEGLLIGLEHAHRAGIVHRDLKPDNVFLCDRTAREPLAKIVDFGISKVQKPKSGTQALGITKAGIVLGTPFYMSPEQAQTFSDVDGRTDLYSVGAICFECLAGRPPHVGETYEQVIIAICTEDAPDVRTFARGVPAEVSEFLRRALKRSPDARFQDAAGMRAALEILPGEGPAPWTGPRERSKTPVPTPSMDVSWTGTTKLPSERKGGRVVVLALVAMVAGVSVTLGAFFWGRTARPGSGATPAPPHVLETSVVKRIPEDLPEIPSSAPAPPASVSQKVPVPPPTAARAPEKKVVVKKAPGLEDIHRAPPE